MKLDELTIRCGYLSATPGEKPFGVARHSSFIIRNVSLINILS